jgi:hypothetical protein
MKLISFTLFALLVSGCTSTRAPQYHDYIEDTKTCQQTFQAKITTKTCFERSEYRHYYQINDQDNAYYLTLNKALSAQYKNAKKQSSKDDELFFVIVKKASIDKKDRINLIEGIHTLPLAHSTQDNILEISALTIRAKKIYEPAEKYVDVTLYESKRLLNHHFNFSYTQMSQQWHMLMSTPTHTIYGRALPKQLCGHNVQGFSAYCEKRLRLH